MNNKAFILDTGANSIKCGSDSDEKPAYFPNSIWRPKTGRFVVSDEIHKERDTASLFQLSPMRKGYIVNWDVQRTIWEHIIRDKLKIDPSEFTAVVTEPHFDPISNQRAIDEVFFEDYGFSAIYRSNNTTIVADRFMELSKSFGCVIVEVGHSFTHIVPYWGEKKLKHAITRLNIGGKLLTNYLKEIISYRQLNLMDEFRMCQEIKEKLCFLSRKFKFDMKKKEELRRLFVLPDHASDSPGYPLPVNEQLPPNAQFISLSHERFHVPELFFSPHEIGINSLGISEAIYEAIMKTDELQRPILFKNIMVIGGSSSFPNFRQRILEGVRTLTSDEYDVRVGESGNPADYAYSCARTLSQGVGFEDDVLTRTQWLEEGSRVSDQFFDQI